MCALELRSILLLLLTTTVPSHKINDLKPHKWLTVVHLNELKRYKKTQRINSLYPHDEMEKNNDTKPGIIKWQQEAQALATLHLTDKHIVVRRRRRCREIFYSIFCGPFWFDVAPAYRFQPINDCGCKQNQNIPTLQQREAKKKLKQPNNEMIKKKQSRMQNEKKRKERDQKEQVFTFQSLGAHNLANRKIQSTSFT